MKKDIIIEKAVDGTKKGKLRNRLMILGGALAGLAVGGWWLSKRSNTEELEDFEEYEDDFEDEDIDSDEESTEE